MPRQNITFGNPYEQRIGFSRAVRIGNVICVSGTAPIAIDGGVDHPGDVFGQTHRCFEIILHAIEEAGGSKEDVIRTRVFMTDIERWQEAAKAHGEIFRKIQPACSFIGVSGFINPEWLVEIEAEAVISHDMPRD